MMESFAGPVQKIWQMEDTPPIRNLTWDWWWWLIMLHDENGSPSGKQLMCLWSTKDTKVIDVSGIEWRSKGRPNNVNGAIKLAGIVAAWYWDGKQLHEDMLLEKCNMLCLPSTHEAWPDSGNLGGAVIPLTTNDLSMGLSSDASEFWMRLETDFDINLRMKPWNERLSQLSNYSGEYPSGMSYEIARLHGTKVIGDIDGQKVEGTGYFQKVCVQAPSPPWFWGMIHLSDGSYIDWFIPHLSATMFKGDNEAWSWNDISEMALSRSALFHDMVSDRSERFARVEVRRERMPNDLPKFFVKMRNGRCSIELIAQAVCRANFTFDQPSRGGLITHLTYNEYPLHVTKLIIRNENGERELNDYDWIRGNAEHSWGLLF